MLKVDCPAITPYEVFKTSGHVEKFTDYICKDISTGEHYRADHVVRDELSRRMTEVKEMDPPLAQEYRMVLSHLDSYSCLELASIISKHKILSPSGAQLEPPTPMNLMFETPIGPSGKSRGFLRPETAQGQFLMFRELLDFNNKAMPFASASIGRSYRNEIAPKSGILRVREFVMAEIEHFMDPEAGKQHPRFGEVEEISLPLLDRQTQMKGDDQVCQVALGKAVLDGTVDNQTLGYFLARTQLFLLKIGIDPQKIRFRQHLRNEMAHYAADCWDVELLTSYGWIECVGCADRSAYDLTAHSRKTGEVLEVRQPVEKHYETEEYVPTINSSELGPRFKQDGRVIRDAVLSLPQDTLERLSSELASSGSIVIDIPRSSDSSLSGKIRLGRDIIPQIAKRKLKKDAKRSYIPNVIEPSFGIGRILYALVEHVLDRRAEEGDARLVLSFPPLVAPTKVLIVPLQLNDPRFLPLATHLQRRLRKEDVSTRIDASGASIGRRYSRNDELGTPLGVTIDFQSFEDGTITLRDRDSTKQVRGSEDEICKAISNIIEGKELWADVTKHLASFDGVQKQE